MGGAGLTPEKPLLLPSASSHLRMPSFYIFLSLSPATPKHLDLPTQLFQEANLEWRATLIPSCSLLPHLRPHH